MGTTPNNTNHLPVRLSDGTGGASVYMQFMRNSGNEAHYALSQNKQDVDITIRPVIVQGLIELSGANVTDATYDTLGADVNLPVSGNPYAWGAWTEIYRYTATNNDEHWDFHAALDGSVNWAVDNGDRGEAAFRMTKKNSAGVTQQMLVPNHQEYIRNHNAVSQDAGVELSTTVDLDTGDYMLLEGRAVRQLTGAGAFVVSNANSIIARAPREVGSAASTGRQVVSSTAPRYLRLWRRTAANLTPNLPVEFSGVVWTGTVGWNLFPVTGTTPAGQALWYGEAEAVHTPGATMDWQTTSTVKPANDVRFSTVQNPRLDTLITATPPASGGYWQFYDAVTGWGTRWFPLETEPDWSYLDQADWRPNAVGSTANIDFPELDTAQYSGLAFLVYIYNSGGHDVSEILNFQLEPLPPIQAAATGTVTITDRYGGNMTWERRVSPAGIEWGDFNLFGGANQANYGKFGCNFQLQHRTTTGTSRIDRVHFSQPQVWQASNNIRWRIELWARRA